jgi:uncharacterized protein
MDDATLEAAVALTLKSRLVQTEVEFLWHAGEPLTVGVTFYEKALNVIHRYNSRNIRVTNSIQTNATLINKRWCEFFSSANFSVGVSLDGPEFLHDRQRAKWSGSGSHREVMRGLGLLREYGIEPGVICVLTRESLKCPEEIFAFFHENNITKIAFNIEEIRNRDMKSSVTFEGWQSRETIIKEYMHFMECFYDLWKPYCKSMLIREISDILTCLKNLKSDNAFVREPIDHAECAVITIQKNGDITAFSPEFAGAHSVRFRNFVVGNVNSLETLDAIQKHQVYLQMREEIAEGRRLCANSCTFFPICGSSFVSNKYFENGSFKSTETTSCILHRQTLSTVILNKLGA